LGCGDNYIDGLVNIDQRSDEETGAGSQKYTYTKPDIVSDVVHMPMIEKGEFDFLLASHVLEHIVDPFKTLREWCRIIKAGGSLLVTCPNHEQLPTMLIDHTHVHAYTIDVLRKVLTSCGWIIAEEKVFDNVGTIGIRAQSAEMKTAKWIQGYEALDIEPQIDPIARIQNAGHDV